MNGGCVLGPGDVVMTARGARQARVSVGDTVDARVTGATSPVQLKVTGIVSLPNLNSPYWWGDGPEDFPLGLSLGASGNPAATDPLIASPSTALNVPSQDVPTAIGQIPLRAGAVSLADEGDVERVLNSTTVELHVRAGEMLAVIGPSGSGKSTPLENVAFAQRGARRRRWPLRWSPEELIDPFDLGSVARRQVHHVSGGEQQRIAIASAMAISPRVLLADEPTARLDHAGRDAVIDNLRRAHELSGATVIIVTHDTTLAGALPRTLGISLGAPAPPV